MKQIVLLEEHEILRLNKGKQLEIITPAGPLVLGFDTHAHNGDISVNGVKGAKCRKCGRMFKNERGLQGHANRKHGGVK